MISLVLTLVLIGFLLFLVESFVPMSDPIRKILRAVVVIAVVIWLLRVFGIDVPIPRLQ